MDEFRKGENSAAIAQDVNFFPSPQGTQQPSHVGATGRVEMPPAYSQMPPNRPGTYNIGQPQGVWNPQGPPSYPQQQPFPYGMYPPQSASIPASGAQGAAIRHGIARSVVVLGQGNRRRSWTYRLTRLAISFLIMGIVLLITLGVLIVGPTINDTKLLSSRCTVISSEKGGVKSCDCGRYCTSHYPCWEIQVTYNDRGTKRKAYLYQNVYASKNKCSAQPCSRNGNSNSIVVYSFRSKFGKEGDSYTCYYNPNTPAVAFKNRGEVSTDKMTVLHCILWPLLVVLISVLSLAALFCRSYGHCCFKKRDASVPYQGLQEARA